MNNPFSDELPELLKTHLEHLKASNISVEVIRERGYRSILGKHDLKELTFGKSQQRAPGILIPLHGVDGTVVGHQYRPDKPRKNAKDKLIKYENPTGSSIRLDVPPRCRGQIGNPGTPIWFTEGVKKVDALASAGACAIGLTGVWGFKGKNLLGGTTILADFDHISFKDRLAYLAFDSDSATNRQVFMALNRLAEHLKRKGTRVRILQLPPGPGDEKVGVDDYLAQGHTLDDLIGLEVMELETLKATLREKSYQTYCIDEGKICWMKASSSGGHELVPLCNFSARLEEDILKDNGLELSRYFKLVGTLDSGEHLPAVTVPAGNFSTMNWVVSEWGGDVIITAGQASKDRLREAIQLQSLGMPKRKVFTHTGWREIDEEMVFLTAAGGIGVADIEVEVDPQLQRYQLPQPGGDVTESIKASFDFLHIGELEVTLPIWTAMYLAPLSEIIDPSFTLWYVGPSGAFKSTITALALAHFGNFDEYHLPASWRDTANQLEKLLFLVKDLPLIIDDWAPGQDSAKARELEVKAEHIVRAQGNRQGKGRMRQDTSSRPNYTPRGLLITSGEQLPSGHSHTARIFAVPIEREDVETELLSLGKANRHLYQAAMADYILWLRGRWQTIKKELPLQWVKWRDDAQADTLHTRLPNNIAHLYAGLTMAATFAMEKGAIESKFGQALLRDGWKIFTKLANEQGVRVEEERPGKRFIEGLQATLTMGTAMLRDKNDEFPRSPGPNQIAVGWIDRVNGHILLDPLPVYQAVYQYYARSGDPFTIKKDAVWKDLKRLRYIDCKDSQRATTTEKLDGKTRRVLALKKQLLGEDVA